MKKPFTCQKCKQPSKRYGATENCADCAKNTKSPHPVGFSTLSQQYLNRPLRTEAP